MIQNSIINFEVKISVLIYIVLFGLLTLRIFHFNATEPIFQTKDIYSGHGEISTIQPGQFGTNRIIVSQFSLTTKESVKLAVGQKIKFSGEVTCPHSQSCQRPWIYKPAVIILQSESSNLLLNASIYVRNIVSKTYSESLKRDQANLMSGIVIGNVTISSQFKSKLATVGLTHVVAASGMNVTLVAGFVGWLLSGARIKRNWALVMTAGILIFYCGVTGFAPPIVRALLMCLAVFAGQAFGRKSAGFFSLIWAAYIMLWVDPSLLTNFSFLLSFASMMGQISVSNVRLSLPNLLQPFGEIFVQTGAAIAFTFPIVMIGFSTFSLVSMVSNFLVLWTIEPLMLLGGIAGIVGFTSIELAKIILIPAGVLLDYFLWVVKVLSNESFLFKFQGFNIWMAIGYYLLLSVIYYYLIYQKRSNALD